MKLNIEVYKNNKIVNNISYLDDNKIFKEFAQVLYNKEMKRATKTTIKSKPYNKDIQIIQIYDSSKTMLTNTTYKYIYYFEGIKNEL